MRMPAIVLVFFFLGQVLKEILGFLSQLKSQSSVKNFAAGERKFPP